jgi:hypothetical protein
MLAEFLKDYLPKPIVEKNENGLYKLKYDIPKSPKDLMTSTEKSELASKVLDFERNPEEQLDATTPTDRIS